MTFQFISFVVPCVFALFCLCAFVDCSLFDVLFPDLMQRYYLCKRLGLVWILAALHIVFLVGAACDADRYERYRRNFSSIYCLTVIVFLFLQDDLYIPDSDFRMMSLTCIIFCLCLYAYNLRETCRVIGAYLINMILLIMAHCKPDEPDSAQLSHTKRKMKDNDKNFYVQDWDPHRNATNIFFMHNAYMGSAPVIHLNLFGRTRYDSIFFPFPVYCDEKTFARFYDQYRLWSRADKFELQAGRVSRDKWQFLFPLFSRLRELRGLQRPFASFQHAGWKVLSYLIFVYLFQVPILHILAFYVFFEMLNFLGWIDPISIYYVIFEELFNLFFGVRLVIAYEFGSRWMYGYVHLFTVIAHLLIHSLPWWSFPLKVLIHLSFNYAMHHVWLDAVVATVDFKDVERIMSESAIVVDVIRKIYYQDTTGLVLSLIQHFPRLRDNSFFFQSNLVSLTCDANEFLCTVKSELSEYFPSEFPFSGATLLMKDDFMSFWLPSRIRHSPTFKRIVAFVMLLVSSKFFGNWLGFDDIGKYIDIEDFAVKGSLLTTIVSAIKSVFDAVNRVVDSGSINAFWDMPKDVYFVARASELLTKSARLVSHDDIVANLAEAQTLIDKRLYLRNDANINKLITRLQDYIVSKREFLEELKIREQPFPIWFNGPPGTGKTTFMDQFVNLLAKHDGVPRAPGDAIKFEIQEKYPLSTGVNKYARYMYMNDIPDIYTDFYQRGLLPADIVFQKLFDTFPCSFPAAAIEDKGVVLNDLKYVVISSNHSQFVFPGDASKLVRRLDYGVLVDLSCVVDGKELEYKDLVDATQAARNDAMLFTVQDVSAQNKHLKFVKTTLKFRLREVLNYFLRRVDAWKGICKETNLRFGAGASLCDCGTAVAIHITNRKESSIVVDVDGLRDVQCLTPLCYKFFEGRIKELSIASILPLNEARATGTISITADSNYGLILLAVISAVLTGGSPYYMFFVCSTIGVLYTVFSMSYSAFKICIFYVFMRHYSHNLLFLFRILFFNKFADWFLLKFSPLKFYYLRAARKRLEVINFLKNNALYLAATTFLVGGVALYKMLQQRSDDKFHHLVSPIYAKDVDPKSLSFVNYRKQINYPVDHLRQWGKESKEITLIEFNTKGTAGDDLERLCKAQTFQMTLSWEAEKGVFRSKNVNVFVFSPDMMCFNKHYLNQIGNPSKFSFSLQGVPTFYDFDELKSTDDNELYVLHHNFPIAARGLHNWFPKRPVLVHANVKLIGDSDFKVCNPTGPFEGHPYPSVFYPREWEKGMCSIPAISKISDGAFIIGVVAYGVGPNIGLTMLSRVWLDALTSKIPYPFIEDYNVTPLSIDFEEEISIHSEARNIDSPYLRAIGTLKGANDSFKTKIKKSVLYEAVLDSDRIKTLHGVPMKDRIVVEGVYHSPFTHTFKYLNMNCDITLTESQRVISALVRRVVDDPRLSGVQVSFLSVEEAIFGNPDLGIDRINFKTSCGAVLKEYGIRNKYDMFKRGDEKYLLDPRIQDRFLDLDNKFRQHICVAPYIDGTVKDEVRPLDKVGVAKLRIFCVLDAVNNLWGRMAIMPLLTILLSFPDITFCYGGMNAGSVEWHELAMRLRRLYKFFDIDFSTFDVCHARAAVRMFAIFMFDLAKSFGMSYDDSAAIYVYVFSLTVQVFRYKKDVYLKFKGLPSGRIETLMFNSIVNLFLLMICFFRLYPTATDEDFWQSVVSAMVGDDNVTSVDSVNFPLMNMIRLQPIYLSMGYVMTPASKSSVFLPYIEFKDLVFLKRRFLEDKELGYIAPLDTDSIYKALMFENCELGVSPEQRLYDVASGAQREFFLHGELAFKEFQSWLVSIFKRFDRNIDELDFVSLKNEYRNKSFRTFAL